MRILYLLLAIAAYSSEIPDFTNFGNTQGAVIFLSTKRSGSNVVSASLSAITRKPISWIWWGSKIFEPESHFKRHPSYNRLELALVTDQPLLYRTHFDRIKLEQIPSDRNRLIFVTRNPKELLFRNLSVEGAAFDVSCMEQFLEKYLAVFEIYESWHPSMKRLVFYEDFIDCSDAILLELLAFMEEEPLFWDDYQAHKTEYAACLLASYSRQHQKNQGGASSKEMPQQIYYTKNIAASTLCEIDQYLEAKAPILWDKYLKRFKTNL